MPKRRGLICILSVSEKILLALIGLLMLIIEHFLK